MFKQTLEFLWEIMKVAVLALVIVIPVRYFLFQPFIVKGVSMEPNFSSSDYLIVDEISYRFREPERGEVVVFNYPKNPSEKFIKRIVGLPGEELELNDNEIIIIEKSGNKIVLNESTYLNEQLWLGQKKIALAENEYFVLGDNRLHSFDSRSWGALSKKFIIGKVAIRVFPLKEAAYFPVPSY